MWDGLPEDAGTPNSLGVTVLVGGVTYSGLLVPGRVWARSMADLLRSAQGGHQVEALGGLFETFAEQYEGQRDSTEVVSYVHLANVAIGLPTDGKRTSLLMRIRVSDISAWTVGTIGELAPFPSPVASSPAPTSKS